MDDAGSLHGLMIIVLVFLSVIRLLNNLLRAGYFGLGRFSLIAFIEKSKETDAKKWSFLEDPIRLNYAAQVFDKLSLFLMICIGFYIFPQPDWIHGVVFLTYLLVFDLLMPNTTAAYIPETLVARLFPILRFVYLLFHPFTFAMVTIAHKGREADVEDDEEVEEEDIKAFLKVGAEEEIINTSNKLMIENLLTMQDTVVREVMTPRTDMECVEINQSREEILAAFKGTKYSRLPVFDGDIDRIEGVLRFKDFFEIEAGARKIADILKKVPFVPENKNVQELITEMLQQRVQMVIVIDEFGGTAGLTTLEDLLEEIVGEIHDEHEKPESDEIIHMPDGSYLIDGKVHLDDFSDLVGIELEEDDIDTVGGFIFNREGRIPQQGSHIILEESLGIEIVKADDRRIYKIRVHVNKEKSHD